MTARLPVHQANRSSSSYGQDTASGSAAALADQAEEDPLAVMVLRSLIQEGLDAVTKGEANDAWLESLQQGVTRRAAAKQ